MTILNIGSVNIDYIHRVTRHPGPGETVLDKGYLTSLGGKGANQSLAAAAAGASVRHAGAVGPEGEYCRNLLAAAGVDVTDLLTVETETARAVIWVDDAGENVIVVHPGANHALTPELIGRAIGHARAGDWLLLQAETNLVAHAARAGKAAGLRVAYAAAPFDAEAAAEMIGLADLICVNEVEAGQLAAHQGCDIAELPVPGLLVTLGGRGAFYRTGGGTFETPAFPVEAVDTTGAGDTFLGFFLAGLDLGQPPATALRRAAAAAALQVTRPGTGEAIPSGDEVDAFLAARD